MPSLLQLHLKGIKTYESMEGSRIIYRDSKTSALYLELKEDVDGLAALLTKAQNPSKAEEKSENTAEQQVASALLEIEKINNSKVIIARLIKNLQDHPKVKEKADGKLKAIVDLVDIAARLQLEEIGASEAIQEINKVAEATSGGMFYRTWHSGFIAGYQDLVNDYKSFVKQIEADLKKELVAFREKYRENLTELRQDITIDNLGTIENIQKPFRDLKLTADKLREENDALRKEHELHASKIATLEKQIQDHEELKDIRETTIRDLSKALVTEKDIATESRQKVAMLETQMNGRLRSLSDANKELSEMRKTIESLKEENKDASSTITILRGEVNALTRLKNELELASKQKAQEQKSSPSEASIERAKSPKNKGNVSAFSEVGSSLSSFGNSLFGGNQDAHFPSLQAANNKQKQSIPHPGPNPARGLRPLGK